MPTAITFGSIAARAFGFLGRVLRKDAFFNYVTLLLTGNGTNGAQNNTFLDSSTNNFTITRNGNTTQGAFSPYGDNWSNYFDGSGDYFTVPNNTAFNQTADFSEDCWVFITGNPANGTYQYFGAADGNPYFQIGLTGTGRFVFSKGFVGDLITSASAAVANTWYHVAITRVGSTCRLFVNGVLQGTATDSSSTTPTSTGFTIGGLLGGSLVYLFTGYISNFRFVRGGIPSLFSTSSTTAGAQIFTPPINPYTGSESLTGGSISLLTCQSNRFIDNSTNNFTITRNGDVSVQRFSPFTAPYAAGTIGGSGYFDGSGDYLSIAGNSAFDFGTGDFTIEAWFYLTAATGAYRSIITIPHGSGGMGIRFGSQTDYSSFLQVTILGNTAAQVYSANINQSQLVNSWVHVALTRASSTCRFFVNGVQQNTGTGVTPSSFPNATFTDNTNITSNGTNEIGRGSDNVTVFLGYISNVRVLKGTAQYTANFTPPTQPLTAITNTSLLTNFTNGGIIDNAMMNDLETVGNAQISTAQSKFGGGSLAFDGTGDRLVMPPSVNLDLSNGDFTVEAWVYTNTVAAGAANVCYRGAAGNIATGAELQWNIYRVGSSLFVRPYQGTTDYTINVGTIAAGTWYHVALTRSGNTFRGFLNGVQAGTTQTISGALNNNTVWFGAIVGLVTVNSVDEAWNGYIDDLRITKGYARYTANFTPPGPLPLQ